MQGKRNYQTGKRLGNYHQKVTPAHIFGLSTSSDLLPAVGLFREFIYPHNDHKPKEQEQLRFHLL